MKIAIIGSRGYPYVYSGYETFVKELSERLVQRGVEVHVYCHRNLFNTYPTQVKGIYLHYIPTIEKKSFSQLVHSLLSLLHAALKRYDVLLVVNAANGPLGIIPRLFGSKTLINVDGLEWLRPKWKGLGAKYFYFAAKWATRLYDIIITDAEEMRNVYLREFKKDSVVIAYGAPVNYRTDENLLSKWGLNSREYYLIVGRLIPDNNAELIISSFLNSQSTKKLVIVGDVPYKDSYVSRLKALESDKLIFLGYVTDSTELMTLYKYCFVYIHGHKFGGTNPTMLKAMTCNCAIMALNTPFNREMLDNRLGLFFEESEHSAIGAMNRMETEDQLISLLRAEVAAGLTKKYNWDEITTQYLGVMKQLMDTKS